VAAPWLMRVFLSPEFFTPDLAEQRESVISFARYCLPQVFFYGMFVLVGQVLNARHRFGPMMWAPIANNVIAVAVLVTYLLVFGPTKDEFGPYTSSQELLLGLGSTLGIVVQFLVLLPYLKAAGVRYRPRFDFRGTGLGHTLRLASWTVGYVIVNQIAYTVVVRLASGGSAVGAETGDPGTGYTIYSQTFLLMMVPHSVITVSLATAILPRLSAYAADGDLAAVSRNVSSTLRTSLSVMIPIALLIPLVSADLTNVVFGWLANAESYIAYAGPLSLFAVGMVFFTTHYMMLRGYYALERTPTVFWVQVVIAVANIGLAVSITRLLPATDTATGLVLAYVGAYLLGATVSYAVLRRLLGGLETPALVRFLGRLLAAALPAAAVAWLVRYGVDLAWPDGEGKVHAAVMLSVLTVVDLLLFVTLARLLRIREVTSVMELVGSRLRR
jgi:putative peptidoglycan lipid II flippase